MLALLLPLTLAVPQSVDHSVLHPADSLVYFEMAGVQAVYREYSGTAYGQVLADPACRTALEKLLREKEGAFDEPGFIIGKQLDMVTDGYWSKLSPVLGNISAASFSVSLHGSTPEALVEGMGEEGFWADETLLQRIEDTIRIQVVVDFIDVESAGIAFGALGKAVAEAPPEAGIVVGNGTYQGRPVARIFASQVPDTNLAAGVFQDGGRVVFVLGADPIQAMEAGHKRADKVSSADRFSAGEKQFRDSSAGVTVFRFQSRLAEAFYKVCPEKEYIQPIIDLLVNVLGPDVDMLLRGGDWRVQLRNGLFVTEAFQKDLNLGGYDRLFSGKALNPRVLDFVSRDAVVASALSIDTEILTDLLEHVFDELGEDPFDFLRTKYNFRPEEDLLANMGTTWVTSLPLKSIGVTSLPGLSLWVDLKDREGFMGGMEKLMDVVNTEAGNKLVAKGKTFRKHQLYTFKMKDARGPEAMLQPTVAVFEDRILVAVSSHRAKGEIKRNLAAESEVILHEFFNSKAVLEGAVVTDLSYADWAKVLGRLYMGAKTFLPMVAGNISPEDAKNLPVDLKALPKAEIFTQFFEPATRYRVRVDGGMVLHSTSSFGPEMSGLIASSMLMGLSAAIPVRTYAQEEHVFIIEAELEEVEPEIVAPPEPEAPR